MSGFEVSGWHFMAFVFVWTIFCCVAGHLLDKLMIKLGWWRAP